MTVLDGVTIGQGSVIGAGSVVTKIPPLSVAVGVPAKVIKNRKEHHQKINNFQKVGGNMNLI